jgi:hypothetical protein
VAVWRRGAQEEDVLTGIAGSREYFERL